MLKSITIKSFQSHKDTTIDFSPGVNVICGKSDSGKSAIIRAIRWVLFNRPLGNSIMTKGSRKTNVILEVISNNKPHLIGHSRSKSSLEYNIDGHEITHIGTEIPKEISDLIDIAPENLALQLDSPFLVMESDGNIAGIINDITHLEKANLLAKELERKRKEFDSKYELNKEKIDQLKKEIENPTFSKLPKLSQLIAHAEIYEQSLYELSIKIDNIMKLLYHLEDIKNKLKPLDSLDKYNKCVTSVLELTTKIENFLNAVVRIEDINKKLSHIEKLNFSRFLVQYSNTIKLNTNIINLTLKEENLNDLVNDVESTHSKLNNIQYKSKEISKKLNTVLESITQCPTCGQVISDKEALVNG